MVDHFKLMLSGIKKKLVDENQKVIVIIPVSSELSVLEYLNKHQYDGNNLKLYLSSDFDIPPVEELKDIDFKKMMVEDSKLFIDKRIISNIFSEMLSNYFGFYS